jgi:hypothetical protein
MKALSRRLLQDANALAKDIQAKAVVVLQEGDAGKAFRSVIPWGTGRAVSLAAVKLIVAVCITFCWFAWRVYTGPDQQAPPGGGGGAAQQTARSGWGGQRA